MNYIIELDVFFCPVDKTLSLNNDHSNSVVLSNQANRLLLEMVTRKSELLNRDDLVKSVWEDYGFTSSNNSLNVAVSEIRKAFSLLGKDPQIISTIPKVGFKFEGVIVPVMEKKAPSTSIPTNKTRRLTITKNIVIFSLLTVLLLFFFAFFAYTHKGQVLNTPPELKTMIYTENKCTVYTLGDQIYSINEIKKDVEHEINKCNIQKMDVFYDKTKNSSIFIGACTLDSQGKYVRCITIRK